MPAGFHGDGGEAKRDGGLLDLPGRLTHFGTAVDVTIAELRLEAFLPGDEATASVFTAPGGLPR